MRQSGLVSAFCCAAGLIGTVAPLGAVAYAQTVEDLQQMSIRELANIDILSVTKTMEPLNSAPAAIYVITHDDIVRSGANSVPEILRLAPNLQVAQTSASAYVITARGMSGSSQAQNFANKLLVLIDGRTVYSPLFEGVYWDMQDVLPEDIERIEVISGPGATLWGANAVNGVINIITRTARQTQGGTIELSGGDQTRSASLQYGGRIGDDLAWRAYVKDFYVSDSATAAGDKAGDHWSKPQGGFRLDWSPPSGDMVTLQGDAYNGSEHLGTGGSEDITGHNLLARWTHPGPSGSSLQVQAYYDRVERGSTADSGRFTQDMYDLDVQHSFSLGRAHQVVWGAGVRLTKYEINSTGGLIFSPSSRTLDLTNAFVQDSVALTSTTKLILGIKLEDDPYSHLTPLPSVRISWNPKAPILLWAAASRAIRSPTPFDRDVIEKIGPTVFLVGGSAWQPERLTAYEFGARAEPTDRLSFSVSAYYNVYDDLRTIEPTPVTFLPLQWGNGMRGYTYGMEAWGDYRVAPWWRISAGLNLLSEHLKFRSGASKILGLPQAGDDPRAQASLKSSMNLDRRVAVDADLRYVGALPDPRVPSYVELGGRIGWNVTDRVQLSLSGINLLHARHQEFPAPAATEARRSVYADLRVRF
ncbi:MAG TPA: TonB-dependent receptor [Caulobacteraceae bacterium]|jgi:iron complex outermembrane receptor protein|nr:TonB-dependent receptor [Caulobacteraceae bacterium]